MTTEKFPSLGEMAPETYAPLSEALKAKLLRVAVPTLSAVMFQKGLHTRFFPGCKPLNPAAAKFCGAAWTIRSIPIREDLRSAISAGTLPSRNRLAFDAAPKGSVVVCGTGSNPQVSMMGDIMSTALMVKGVAGVVLDTSVSDAHIVGAMPFPVMAAGSVSVSSFANLMVIDHDTPIGIQGVAVFPGDLIVGDENGAVCVPRHLGDEIADAAIEQEQLEVFVLERIKAGAPIDGTYPPNAEVLAAYGVWRAARDARA
jgi:regulator of RNase E activity RraA